MPRCGRPKPLYFKKARSGVASEILEQGGGTQCRKERHSAAFLSRGSV